jgi:hypothetical protein
MSGGGSGELLNTQLATLTQFGTSAYHDAINAMNEIRTAFGDGGPSDSAFVMPGGWYGGGAGGTTPGQSGSISLIAPAPVPDTSGIEFDAPDAPKLLLGDLEDIDSVLADIIDRLTALMDEMPEYTDVSVEDRFLVLMEEYILSLAEKLKLVLEESTCNEDLDNWLKNALREDLPKGMPIPIEQAIRDRADDLLTRQAGQAQREAADEWAAKGFSLPSGVLDAKLAAIRQQAGDKEAELNRDLYIEANKWERDERHYQIERVIQMQLVKREEFNKQVELAKSIAETWQEQQIKVALALIEVYKARIQAWGQAAEALGKIGSTAALVLKAKLDEQLALVELYKAELLGETERVGTKLKIVDANTRIYGAKLETAKAKVDVQLKLEDQDLELKRLDTSIELKSKELELQKLSEVTKVSVAALDGIARTASQLAAGALSALHMSASLSTGVGYNNSSGCNTSYNYSF